jgi:hypothetical protein
MIAETKAFKNCGKDLSDKDKIVEHSLWAFKRDSNNYLKKFQATIADAYIWPTYLWLRKHEILEKYFDRVTLCSNEILFG